MCRGSAAAPTSAMRRALSLICEACGQTAREMIRRREIVSVITVLFTRREDVERVMKVVVPLRRECARPPQHALEQRRVVAIVLEHQVHFAIHGGADPLCELHQEVR